MLSNFYQFHRESSSPLIFQKCQFGPHWNFVLKSIPGMVILTNFIPISHTPFQIPHIRNWPQWIDSRSAQWVPPASSRISWWLHNRHRRESLQWTEVGSSMGTSDDSSELWTTTRTITTHTNIFNNDSVILGWNNYNFSCSNSQYR